MMTELDNKQSALIKQLLDSPLAKELERMNSADAVRKRTAADLKALKEKNKARLARLSAEARDAITKRDELRREFDAANIVASKAIERAEVAQHSFAQEEADLKHQRAGR
jgi:hypothetical protein